MERSFSAGGAGTCPKALQENALSRWIHIRNIINPTGQCHRFIEEPLLVAFVFANGTRLRNSAILPLHESLIDIAQIAATVIDGSGLS